MKNLKILLCFSFLFFMACANDSDSSTALAPNTASGQGGSLARFAIADDYLYILSGENLESYDISDNQNPQRSNQISVGNDIETVFPYQNMLFIGTQSGMLIYNRDNPSAPTYVSRYEHIVSCDPVVVQGDYAYVTLRSGTACRFGQNLLDVIDISNPSSPQLVSSQPMLNPHGLGVDGNNLFVCEGSFGLKVFNIENPIEPEETQFIDDIHSFDVIPRNNLLILTGDDGVFQYEYDNSQNLTFLSQIK